MQTPTTLINIVWSDPIPYAEALGFVGDTDFGIYQIYGTHPIHANEVLLYIGRAKNGSFGWRLPQHKEWVDKEDVADIRVYLGRLAGATTPPDEVWNKQIEMAELLLIFAHQPPMNTRVGLGCMDTALECVHVCNWGARADVFPEVSGLRWTAVGVAAPKNLFRVGGSNNGRNATGNA